MSYALAGVSLRLMDCILVVAVSIVGPMFLVAYRPLPYCWADMLGTKGTLAKPRIFVVVCRETHSTRESRRDFVGFA